MNEKNTIAPTTGDLDKKAVAIKRDTAESTPQITAKGSGYNAEKILDIAFAEGVKVRQDEDLTNLLDAFEVESPVPLEALHAVSLILQKVYEANADLKPDTEIISNTEGHSKS